MAQVHKVTLHSGKRIALKVQRSGIFDIIVEDIKVMYKIAEVLEKNEDINVMVEGHTDDVPYGGNGSIEDNWDLSTKRATAIVRLMQTDFNVQPERMSAGGRSEYVPKATNETSEGRAANRRTEIIILPKLDQFFNLLTPPAATSVD